MALPWFVAAAIHQAGGLRIVARVHPSIPVPGRACARAAAAVVGLAVFTTLGLASPTLETFVLVAGGVSVSGPAGCTSFGSPPTLYNFFSDYGVSVPLGGLSVCGVPGGFDDQWSSTGPLTDNRSLGNSWAASAFSGTTTVVADYGRLSSQAHADFAGDTSSLTVTGAKGFTVAADGFMITSPSFANGQFGTVVFRTTVAGSLSTTGMGTAGLRVDYRVNAGADVSMLRSSVSYATVLPTLDSIGGVGLGGFARVPGGMSGSGEVATAAIPIVFGTRFDYKLALLAYATPLLTSMIDVDFDAAITAIEVKGPGGQIVNDFVIVSDSGTVYGAGGVVAVGDYPNSGDGNPSRLAAYPNPAGTEVRLSFNLKRAMATSLDIYDSAGRRVRHLEGSTAGEGDQSAVWDCRGDRGLPLSSGVYFARLSWEGGFETTRLTLLR